MLIEMESTKNEEVELVTKKEVKQIVKEVLAEDKKNNKEFDSYSKVELMLKHYNNFKKRIENLKNELNSVVIKKQVSYDIVLAHKYDNLSDLEKVELKKEEIKQNILKYESVIELIEIGLKGIKEDKYYELIPLKYFKCYSVEEVTEKLEIDRSTYFRNRSRLITELSELIFPDEILKKIL